MKKKIGILGGMGPKATVYLFDRIVQFTDAGSDSSHIPIIIFNNTQIPDRTEAIINNGLNPLPLLIQGSRFLERSGVDFIVMPCVTAHYFYPEIVKNIEIPFLHLIEETARHLESRMPGLQKAGLLATTGTIETRIFQDHLVKKGKDIVIPGRENQLKIMEAIYGEKGIKAGFTKQPKKIIKEVVSHLLKTGCRAVIAGCTEIPLALEQEDISVPFIDPLTIIARRAVREAGYPLLTPAHHNYSISGAF